MSKAKIIGFKKPYTPNIKMGLIRKKGKKKWK